FRVLEKLLWERFSRASAFLRRCGCGIFTPSVVAMSDSSPRSTPTGDSNFVSSCDASPSPAYTREAYHSPFGSLTTVQVFNLSRLAGNSLWKTALTLPTFERKILFLAGSGFTEPLYAWG